MVINERVDVVVARTVDAVTRYATTMHAPASTVGDATDLLDVHVHQLAGPFAFVAHRGLPRGTDHLPGDRVAVAQVGHAVAAQDPRDRPRRYPDWDPTRRDRRDARREPSGPS